MARCGSGVPGGRSDRHGSSRPDHDSARGARSRAGTRRTDHCRRQPSAAESAMNTREMVLRTVCGLLVLLPACRRGDASEESELAGGVITVWTDSTELFMEHPALIVGDSGKFAVHLTDLTDFAPLRTGRITMRFQPRAGGAPLLVTQDVPRAPGIYGPAPRFTAPGVYDLTILVDSPQARDSIKVADLRVYASAAEAPRDEGGGDDGISFLKEQQWKTPGFRTAFAVSGSMSGTFTAPGIIGPAAGRYAEVAATTDGLVDPGGLSSAPIPGSRVARGQVLAW